MLVERDEWKLLVAVGLAFAVFATLVWLPAWAERSSLTKQIDQHRQELGAAGTSASVLTALHEEVGRLRQIASGAQRYVPQEDEQDELLRSLAGALSQFDVQEQEILADKERSLADYYVVPVRLRFQADFGQVYGVLRQLESMPRLIRVERLEMEHPRKEVGQPLDVRLELSTFFSSSQEVGS